MNYCNVALGYPVIAMSRTDWLSTDEMRLWRTFLKASAAVMTNVDASFKKAHDIGVDDYEVLVHLSEAEGHRLRMSELSAVLLHSRSRLTQRVDRLEKRSYVERQKCADDGRGTWAVLTDSGSAALKKAAPDHLVDVRTFFFDHIDTDDVPALADALEGVADQLENKSNDT